jgi:hypothetical protein
MLVFTGDEQRVEEIKRNGFDPHQCFTGPGSRRVDISQLQRFGRPKMRAENSLHSSYPVLLRPASVRASHNHENRRLEKRADIGRG